MLSITIHGPATATLQVASHRILLGAADAPAGDPIIAILNRVSVEDCARLPALLRNHNKVNGKPSIITGDSQRLAELLRTDEICQATVSGKPMGLSLESYAALTEAPEAGKAMGIYRAEGFGIFVDRCSWTREGDALRTWLYNWDAEGEHNELIKRALFEGDREAFDEVNHLEQSVTDELDQIGKRIAAGEDVKREEVPQPILKRYVWAPYYREAAEGFAHLTFTMRRPPYDAGSVQARAVIPRCKYIEDLIGKELHL